MAPVFGVRPQTIDFNDSIFGCRKRTILGVFILVVQLAVVADPLQGGEPDARYDSIAVRLIETGLRTTEAYDMLKSLTAKAGHRLSGSEGAAAAVELTRQMMKERGFDRIHLEPVMVPRWVRGPREEAIIVREGEGGADLLTVCALGGSVGTGDGGVGGDVVEVRSFDQLHELGQAAHGKIVFFNRPFDRAKLNTFEAYGGAVDQRSRGAIEASKSGAVAVLVRSMTHALDDVPHTGAMGYVDSVRKIPAAAISTLDADYLSNLLKSGTHVTVRLTLSCQTLPDVPSANVVGELTGTEFPNEVIVVGGHLDSWDKGTGAHDDGAGCVQAIEALHLLKTLELRPKRTIRAVMFMNEENGVRGGKGYAVAPERTGEIHVAGVESDRGGFAPRGIAVQADSTILAKVVRWRSFFEKLNAGNIIPGYSGVDISPLVEKGVPGFGLDVENHRYFDYHHSDNDTIDKVNPRELELGAIVEALLCYLIAEEGL